MATAQHTTETAATTPDGRPGDRGVAVHCRGVTKHYGEGSARVVALRGIDLEINAGELMMLVGPSGCGKTTLISVIAGILDRDAGECTVLGADFAKMSAPAKTRFRGEKIGFVFQSFNLIPTLSAAENVAVPLMILGEGRNAAVKKGKEMLARMGLGDRARSLPSQLSGGQQQRVAIARALVHDPQLVVCDEPTSALDHDTGHKVMELFKEVAVKAGRVLIIVTHDQRIYSFADRIAKLDDGAVQSISTGAQYGK